MGLVRGVLRDYFCLNVISTRFFAEGEFWFSLVKWSLSSPLSSSVGRRFSALFDAGWLARAGAE